MKKLLLGFIICFSATVSSQRLASSKKSEPQTLDSSAVEIEKVELNSNHLRMSMAKGQFPVEEENKSHAPETEAVIDNKVDKVQPASIKKF